MTTRTEETLQLLQTYRESRSAAAREQLVAAHMALVRRLCRRFSPGRQTREALFQVGGIGLLKAINKFDPALGSSFVAFAIPEVLGEILNYFRDHGRSIKVPRRIQQNSLHVQRALDRVTQELGRWPTIPELAEATGLSPEEVYETFEMESSCRLRSLDAGSDPDAPDQVRDPSSLLGEDDKELDAFVERASLKVAMTALDYREALIITLKFFRGLSQSQIAQRMGISQMHVSRLQRNAVTKLRHALSQREPAPTAPGARVTPMRKVPSASTS